MQRRNRNPIAAAVDLEAAKAAARKVLARQAEAARQRFLTPGDLKSSVYTQKQAEAARWQEIVDGSGTPDPAEFPFLKARAERLNPGTPDYQAVADEWTAKVAVWVHVAGPEIENSYEAAVEAVEAAADMAAVEAATRVDWPTP